MGTTVSQLSSADPDPDAIPFARQLSVFLALPVELAYRTQSHRLSHVTVTVDVVPRTRKKKETIRCTAMQQYCTSGSGSAVQTEQDLQVRSAIVTSLVVASASYLLCREPLCAMSWDSCV